MDGWMDGWLRSWVRKWLCVCLSNASRTGGTDADGRHRVSMDSLEWEGFRLCWELECSWLLFVLWGGGWWVVVRLSACGMVKKVSCCFGRDRALVLWRCWPRKREARFSVAFSWFGQTVGGNVAVRIPGRLSWFAWKAVCATRPFGLVVGCFYCFTQISGYGICQNYDNMTPKNPNFRIESIFCKKHKVRVFWCHIGIFGSYLLTLLPHKSKNINKFWRTVHTLPVTLSIPHSAITRTMKMKSDWCKWVCQKYDNMTPKNPNFSHRVHFCKKHKVRAFWCHIGIFLSCCWFTHKVRNRSHKTYNTSPWNIQYIDLFPYYIFLPVSSHAIELTQKVTEQCVLLFNVHCNEVIVEWNGTIIQYLPHIMNLTRLIVLLTVVDMPKYDNMTPKNPNFSHTARFLEKLESLGFFASYCHIFVISWNYSQKYKNLLWE